jgi:two-component system, NtrC family, sensor kinase
MSSAQVHILVVDDDPDIAGSLHDYLIQQENYRVSVAADGREAIPILTARPGDVDLVLLDMWMPNMSGAELLHWIRNHEELKYTRVIVLTAASNTQDMVEALSNGADDYVTKPYYPQELLARVQTTLRTQQLEKQLQRQRRQLAELNRFSHIIVTTLESRQLFSTAVESTLALLDVELAAVFLLDEKRDSLECQQVKQNQKAGPAAAFNPVPAEASSALRLALLNRHSLCLNEPQAETQFDPQWDAPAAWETHSLLITRFVVRERPVGVLAAWNKKGGPFTSFDSDLFSALAVSVGRALENSWLFQGLQQRQRALLESRNTLQAIIDAILHPIYTINENWQLVAINHSKLDTLQTENGPEQLLSPAEDGLLPATSATGEPLLKQACYQAFFGRDEPCNHCQAAVTLEKRRSQRWPVRWLDDSHLPQEWDVTAYPVPGTEAGAARAVIIWQDRTDERRLENSLLQAGKLAAIGQLAAGVAHEINNPLTVINTNAEILKMVLPVRDENYESVEMISRAGERAAKVVRGLLDFARQAQYELLPGTVNDSIEQALELVTYQLESANIQVTLNLADELPELTASWEHLNSVWLNLLLNARDALAEAPRPRQLEIRSGTGPQQQVIVAITDNGPGMTAAEVSHIFEPFYTTKGPGQGTGLGLATCHRIIEQHNGQIEVVTTPGQGASFIVHLPVS